MNTTISRQTLGNLDRTAELLVGSGIDLWSVFFLVRTGRAGAGDLISPDEAEEVMHRLAGYAEALPFDIRTTAAPHYRRVLLQRPVAARRRGGREADLVEVYRESPLFRALRDSDRLQGKCGVCGFRQVCGGSRTRAYALSGDVLGPEPICSYEPPRWKKRARRAASRTLPMIPGRPV